MPVSSSLFHLAASVSLAAQAQAPADVNTTLESFYTEYLQRYPWGAPSKATTFKSLTLGQRLALGEGTHFRLCKPIKDINGRDTCWGTDLTQFECPLTPPVIKCSLVRSTDGFSDPQLNQLSTAFGQPVKVTLTLLTDRLMPGSPRTLQAKLTGISLEATNAPKSMEQTALQHFTEATGTEPKVELDTTDRAVVSAQCKRVTDELFAGKRKTEKEVADAIKRCETNDFAKFLTSMSRWSGYSWDLSDSASAPNKVVYLISEVDLGSSRTRVTMTYKADALEKEFSARMQAYLNTVQQGRAKSDF